MSTGTMGMASDNQKHQLTTFTSIGSQESLDQLGRDCGHGWSPEPSIYCQVCSCHLCLDCYPSHNRHFHSGATQGTGRDSPHHDRASLRSVSPQNFTSKKDTRPVLNVASSFEADLQTENWQLNNKSHNVNGFENQCYHIAEEKLESQTEEDTCDIRTKEAWCDSQASDQAQHEVSKQAVLPFNMKRITATYVANIGCDQIPKPTRITGMILIDSMLIAADFCNKCIKVIETDTYEMVSEVKLTTGPWDLTEVNKGQIAVTLTDEQKITFLKLQHGNLSQEREISTNGYCDGIACHNDMLVVTFINPANLKLLDLQGNHLPSFANPPDLIFGEPRHVAISADGQRLYVSDFQKNEVVCMTVHGQVLYKYTSSELQGPEKLTICDDNVFVCGASSNNLHLISAQCEYMSIVLTEKDGLKYPQSMCSCLATKKLFIGLDGDVGIKVYELQENKRKKKKRMKTKLKEK